MSNKTIKGGLTLEAPCEGGASIAITLTPAEVAQAKSILARLGCSQLYVMKRDAKSAAMFYAKEADAVYAQQAYGIDYLMTVEAGKFNGVADAPKAPEMPKAPDAPKSPKDTQVNG